MSHIKMPQFPLSYWRDSVDLPDFPKLEKSLKADVGIVGAGITGITAAYLLAKQNIKVVLIEAGEILTGTTGHTTAKITAQHGFIYDTLIQNFGVEKASLYYKAQQEAMKSIKKWIQNEEISCDFENEAAYLFTDEKEKLQSLEKEQKAYDQLNIPYEYSQKMPLDIPHKAALIMKNQAQFHPVKYLHQLLEVAIRKGVQVFEDTTAIDIEYNKRPAIVTKENHRIVCDKVIQATHYPFHDGQGFYPVRMYPERSYILGVKTSKNYPGGIYINIESPTRSLRKVTLEDEDLWLIVGENHKTGQGKPTIEHYYALEDFARAQFPITQIPYRWSAQDLTTLDQLPYIGPVSKGRSSVFVATGYRKWGMTNGTIAAKIITDEIIDEENVYKDLFLPSRFHAEPMIRQFIQSNTDVAKHLIQGKIEFTKDLVDSLKPDEATITRVKGMRTGVYKDFENQLHAVDTTCKHMGCEVNWNSGERTWDCPCHGSRYSYTGEVLEGPAKEPLNKVDLDL